VERSASGRTDRWIRITRQPVTDTRYNVTELVEGNEYQFRISAENAVGTGPPGPESDSILAKDPWGSYVGLYIRLQLLVITVHYLRSSCAASRYCFWRRLCVRLSVQDSHNFGKECRSLTNFCTNNTSNCKQVAIFQ